MARQTLPVTAGRVANRNHKVWMNPGQCARKPGLRFPDTVGDQGKLYTWCIDIDLPVMHLHPAYL
jgi:hypothetical protein